MVFRINKPRDKGENEFELLTVLGYHLFIFFEVEFFFNSRRRIA